MWPHVYACALRDRCNPMDGAPWVLPTVADRSGQAKEAIFAFPGSTVFKCATHRRNLGRLRKHIPIGVDRSALHMPPCVSPFLARSSTRSQVSSHTPAVGLERSHRDVNVSLRIAAQQVLCYYAARAIQLGHVPPFLLLSGLVVTGAISMR